MSKFTSQEVEALQNGGNQVQTMVDILSLSKNEVHVILLIKCSFFPACKGNIFEGLGSPKAKIA